MFGIAGDERQAEERNRSPRFTQLVAFWVPRRFVEQGGIDVDAFVADVNEKIAERGFVLYDGNVLTKSLDAAQPVEVVFEPQSLDVAFEVPVRRDWQSEQQTYFGLESPYQMADEADTFTWSHIMTLAVGPYLRPDERIVGIIHGTTDRRYFYCPCHFAEVVYTTRHRLVCMSCGSTHLVLREPLTVASRQLLTTEEWVELFDEQGTRHHEEVDIPIIDFCDIENADVIWTTSEWEDAVHEFVFFARSSPEEIAEAIRGTESDPAILREAGFTPEALPPPPAVNSCPARSTSTSARTPSTRCAKGLPPSWQRTLARSGYSAPSLSSSKQSSCC